MPIEKSCPHCRKRFQFDARHAGRKFQCSGCQKTFVVDQLEPANAIPTQSNTPPNVSNTPAITAAPKKRNKIFRAAKFQSRRARLGFCRILMDFDFKHYFTPQLIRSSWRNAVIGFFLSLVLSVFILIGSAFPRYLPWGRGFDNPVQTLIGLILFELFFLYMLISYRILLEFLIVVFDISETLKDERSKS
jgi:hypothetical protein